MDARDREAEMGKWYNSFDEKAMTVTITDLEDEEGNVFDIVLPVKYEVCGLCNGKGSHVNPSIDSHGISADEFYEDPEFEEEYFSGTYDVSCYRCNGKRVEPEINEDYIKMGSEELKKHYELYLELQRDRADYYRECAAERRMGC